MSKIFRNKEIKPEGFPEAMSMDDIEDGTTYGKINRRYVDEDGNIKAKSIVLSGIDGTLDDIEDGANFGKVALTAISAGKIVLTGGGGVTGVLPVGNTEADKTSDNPQDYSWVTGTKPPPDADKTSDNPQSVAWLTDAGAMAYEDMVEKAKLGTTILSGGYIRTELLTADNIVTGILTGIRIRTSASGQRVELYSDEVQIHSSSGSAGVMKGLYVNGVNYCNFTGPVQIDGELTMGSTIRPTSSNIRDLGSSSYKWRHAYLDQNLYMDSGQYIYWGGNAGFYGSGSVIYTTGGGGISIYGPCYPSVNAIHSLGYSSNRWEYLYLDKKIYWGGSSYYFYHDGDVFKINDDLQPSVDSSKRLGYTNMAWYAVHADNYLGCHLPTSNSGIGVFRKIKKPKIESGKEYHHGKRHYFKIDEFPDEMKMTDKDSGEKDIELTRTLGVTVSAVRELVEKFDDIDNRLKYLENNKNYEKTINRKKS